jgi:Archaeal holliday junction resolvase (hjc)
VVGHGFGSYERELRRLLSGSPADVRRYARTLPPTDRAGFERLSAEPFLVIRAAGSFGFDLVALRRDLAFPIEVKASSDDVIRFTAASGRANAQLSAHREAVGRVGLLVLYAYRRLGERSDEPWRLFVAGTPPETGILRYVCRRIPPVSATRDGNGILRWGEGLPLSKFVGRVHDLLRPAAAVAP